MTLLDRDYDLPTDEVSTWVEIDQIDLSLGVYVATAIIYDTVITMDKEVRYFWDTKLTFMKIVFFVNRYVGIIGAVISLMHAITVISIDYVLTIRVLALYHNERTIRVFLYILLALEAIGKILFMVFGTKSEPADITRLSLHLTSCGYNDETSPALYIVDWTLFLAYGTLLLCLALFKGRQFWKLNGYNGSRLVAVLIRDQTLYFAIAIVSSVMAIVGDSITSDSTIVDILLTLGRPTFLSILGSHMFFNVKEAAEHGVNVGTNWSSYSHSAIHFDEPTDSEHGAEPNGTISTVSAGQEEEGQTGAAAA